MKVQVQEQEYYMDGYLKSNLDISKKVISKDWDMILVVDGYEGTGKSVMAFQIAKYCDPTFDLNRIAFNSATFVKAVKKAKQYQSIVYDEAYGGLSSRATLSETNRALCRMLAEIRQKNLFVLIVLPTIFELDRYVALWRSRALIHVYTSEGMERGRFSFYSAGKKKKLYMEGKRTYSYGVAPDFIGRFTNFYVIDEQEYRKRKLKAIEDREAISMKRYKAQRDGLIVYLNEKGVGLREISLMLEEMSGWKLSERHILRIINAFFKKRKPPRKSEA
jgi:hypothetical protein